MVVVVVVVGKREGGREIRQGRKQEDEKKRKGVGSSGTTSRFGIGCYGIFAVIFLFFFFSPLAKIGFY